MPDDAKAGEDAIVFADMRRKFGVDALAGLQIEVLFLQPVAIGLRPIVEAQRAT